MSDGVISLVGFGGDNTDLIIDLDGIMPVLSSGTDVSIGILSNLLVGATSVTGVHTDFSLSGDDIYADGDIAAQDKMYADSFVAGDSSTEYGDGSLTSSGALVFEAFGTFTWQDDDSNPLMTLTDSGTTGALDVTGTLSATDITCTNCLDFTDFEDILDLDAALTVNQTTNTWTQSFTGTTTNGFSYAANSLTAGRAVDITSSSTALTTGSLLSVNHTATYGAETVNGNMVQINRVLTADSGLLTVGGPALYVSSANVEGSGTLDDLGPVLRVDQLNSSSDGAALLINNTSTSNGIDINHTGNGTALAIFGNGATDSDVVNISDGALTTGRAFVIDIDSPDLTSGDLVFLRQDPVYTVNTTLSGGFIDMERVLEIDGSGQTLDVTGAMLRLTNANHTITDGAITDSSNMVFLEQLYEPAIGDIINIFNAGDGSAIDIFQDSESIGNVIDINNEGTGNGLDIDHTSGATGNPIFISNASTNESIFVDANGDTGGTLDDTNGGAIHLSNTGNDGKGITIYSANTSGSTDSLLQISAASGTFGGKLIDLDNSGDGNAINIIQDSTSSGNVIRLINLGTGNGLDILHNTGATGNPIFISNVSTNESIFVDANGDTGGTLDDTNGGAIHLSNTGNDDKGITIYSANTSAFTDSLFQISAASGTFGGELIDLDNSGDGNAINISQAVTSSGIVIDLNNLGTGNSLDIDHTSGATGNPIFISNASTSESIFVDANGDTGAALNDINGGAIHLSNTGNDGIGMSIYTANSNVSADALFQFFVDNGTFGGDVINIFNEGDGAAILATNTSDSSANVLTLTGQGSGNVIDIQSTAFATGRSIDILQSNDNESIFVTQAGDTGTTIDDDNGGAIHVANSANSDSAITAYTNKSVTTSDLVRFVSDHISSDSNVLSIQQDGQTGAGLYITQNTVDNPAADAVGNQALIIDVNEAANSDEVIIIRSDADGTPNTEFRFENDGDLFGNGATYNTPADFAEFFFATDTTLAAAEMICRDPATADGVKRCEAGNNSIMGVISTDPGFVGNNIVGAGGFAGDDPNYKIVGLLGQIPTLVNADEGAIAIGDPIMVSSSMAGYGAKAKGPVKIVGFALDSLASGTGTIKVMVDPQVYIADILSSDSNGTNLDDNLTVTATGTATAVTTGYESSVLSLRGSGWNGAAAEAVQMKMVTDVTDSTDYHLSIRNTADTEVAYITNTGAMTVSGDMTIGGKLYPSDQGVLQSNFYIFFDSSLGPGLEYMRTNAAGWATGSYDFAEMFPSDDDLEAGDVVVFSSKAQHVQKSHGTYDKRIAGIVSTRPGFLAGEQIIGHTPIALAGRVPTKVTTEGGSIAVGDPLTTSSTSGFAMKAVENGPIIGYALEPYSGSGDNKIIVFVDAGYYGGGIVPTNTPGTTNTASNLSGNLSSLNMDGNIYMQGASILNIGSLRGIAKNWSIEADGTFRTDKTFTTVIESYQGEKIETHAVTSTDVMITLVGTGTLENGRAIVKFENVDPSFNDVTSIAADVRVVVTPNGPVSLYVSQKDHNGFTVEQVGGGNSDASFDWMVSAFRKDYEPKEEVLAEEVPVEEEVSVEEPTPEPTPAPEPEPVPEPTPEPVPEPEPIPEPEPDPVSVEESAPIEEPAPEPAPEPEPEPTPEPEPVPEEPVAPEEPSEPVI